MLVLTRRVGEEIVIAGDIHITVLSVTAKAVRLGIVAPRTTSVDREEIHHRRQRAADRVNRHRQPVASDGQAVPAEESRVV